MHGSAPPVSVSKTGFAPFSQNVWLVDCKSQIKLTTGLKNRRDEILARLAGYAFIKDLSASGKSNSAIPSPFSSQSTTLLPVFML